MLNLKANSGNLLPVGVVVLALGFLGFLWIGTGLSTHAQGGTSLIVNALVNPLDTAVEGKRGEAILLVTVQSNSGLTADLTKTAFAVDTEIVPTNAGSCPVTISQSFGQFKPGIYLFGLTPISGCNWTQGDYDITVVVSSNGAEGVALTRMTIVQ